MSNIYIQEPPTEGKVCLETTAGDIDIELWSREAPKACRNFVQLCMEGYYDGTIFHRLVKGFIVQGGDPTGTGMGGNSVWGKTFKDEFHSRLRFVRRGLVAMANAGKDDNGSQFFFTLGPTPELQNKHTVFGKVGGNTIYNMLKLEDGMTDENEKPLYPHKILKTKVLSNPYNDIVPRESIKKFKEDKKEKSKSKSAATKNYKLLSFGEEAEEDEEEVEEVNKKFSGKSKSSHDLTKDPKLSSQPAVVETSSSQKKKKSKSKNKEDSDSESSPESDSEVEEKHKSDSDKDPEKDRRQKAQEIQSVRDKLKRKDKKEDSDRDHHHKKSKHSSKSKEDDDNEPYYLGKDEEIEKKKKLEELKKQYKELRKTMKKEKDEKDEAAEKASKEEEDKAAKLAQDNSVIKAYIAEQEKYKTVKAKAPKKGEDREAMTLALLAKFKSKIETAKETYTEKDQESKDKEEGEKEDDEEEDNPDDISWLAKKLQNENKEEVLAKDANRKGDDWFDIYDPRNSLSKRRREKGKEESKEKIRSRINM